MTNVNGPGSGPIFVQLVGNECTGSEPQLFDCDIRPLGFPTSSCSSHSTDAAVVCGRCLLISLCPCCIILNYFISDFDECSQTNVICGTNAKCIDEVRNFTCECLLGYTGNPFEMCSGNSHRIATQYLLMTTTSNFQILMNVKYFRIGVMNVATQRVPMSVCVVKAIISLLTMEHIIYIVKVGMHVHNKKLHS